MIGTILWLFAWWHIDRQFTNQHASQPTPWCSIQTLRRTLDLVFGRTEMTKSETRLTDQTGYIQKLQECNYVTILWNRNYDLKPSMYITPVITLQLYITQLAIKSGIMIHNVKMESVVNCRVVGKDRAKFKVFSHIVYKIQKAHVKYRLRYTTTGWNLTTDKPFRHRKHSNHIFNIPQHTLSLK